MPSTTANILDLLTDYQHIVKINDNISVLYIAYQVKSKYKIDVENVDQLVSWLSYSTYVFPRIHPVLFEEAFSEVMVPFKKVIIL